MALPPAQMWANYYFYLAGSKPKEEKDEIMSEEVASIMSMLDHYKEKLDGVNLFYDQEGKIPPTAYEEAKKKVEEQLTTIQD